MVRLWQRHTPARSVGEARLTAEQREALERVIARAKEQRSEHSETLSDNSQAYAYPHADGIAHGINSGITGFCIYRDVRR